MSKFCSNCGNQLNDGAKFCPKCGTAVSAPASSPSQTYSQSAPQYQNPVITPQRQQPTVRRSSERHQQIYQQPRQYSQPQYQQPPAQYRGPVYPQQAPNYYPQAPMYAAPKKQLPIHPVNILLILMAIALVIVAVIFIPEKLHDASLPFVAVEIEERDDDIQADYDILQNGGSLLEDAGGVENPIWHMDYSWLYED